MRRFACSVLAIAAAVLPRLAEAQACCAGAAAGELGRLTLHEEALLGVDLRAVRTLGAFGDDASFRAARVEALQFEQSFVGTLRLGEAVQVGAVLPLVGSFARTPRESGFGGGLGDVRLSARCDFTFAGASRTVPGIALLGGVAAPSGRPVEATDHPLGVEATGMGRWRSWLGAAVEQSHGWAFAQIAGAVIHDAPRDVGDRRADARWGATGSVVLGASLPSEWTLAASALYEVEPRSPRRNVRFGLGVGHPLRDWRLQGGVFTDAPFGGLGRNQTVQAGFHFALMRIWT
ncbi:MAG TPA: hypothetical protein VKY51_08305 [Fredinandcohnia sp.]|nr:hypothetical protein [Fredinandcohnia sp.]